MSKIFLTGGSGFIGSKLTSLLLKEGFSVRALARSTKSKTLLKSLGAEIVDGNIADKAALVKGMEGCTIVFHLAGLVSFKYVDRQKMLLTNVDGTKNILAAIEKSKVEKFIYCSSVAALGGSGGTILNELSEREGPFLTTYEKTKTMAHQLVFEASKKRAGIVIAMPSFVMGPGGSDVLGAHIKAFCRGRIPFLVNVNTLISYVFVDDVVEGLYLCMTKGLSGEQYILTSQSCTSFELMSILERYCNKKRPAIMLSPLLAKPLLVIDEIAETMVGKHPLLTIELLRKLESKSWVYSSEKASKQLGWSPRNLEEMVKETVAVVQAK